jgi:hypothetical protein
MAGKPSLKERIEIASTLPKKSFRVGSFSDFPIEDAKKLERDEVISFRSIEYGPDGEIVAAIAAVALDVRNAMNKANQTPPKRFLPPVGTRGHLVRTEHGLMPSIGEGIVVRVDTSGRSGVFLTDEGDEYEIDRVNDFRPSR